MRIVPVVLLLAALVAGCGSSGGSGGGTAGGDAAAVKQANQDYVQALASKDAAKACSLISQAQKAKNEAGGKCETLVAKGLAATGTDPYKNPQVETPHVSGSTATAKWTVTVKGQSLSVVQKLVKEDGQWKLDSSSRG